MRSSATALAFTKNDPYFKNRITQRDADKICTPSPFNCTPLSLHHKFLGKVAGSFIFGGKKVRKLKKRVYEIDKHGRRNNDPHAPPTGGPVRIRKVDLSKFQFWAVFLRAKLPLLIIFTPGWGNGVSCSQNGQQF